MNKGIRLTFQFLCKTTWARSEEEISSNLRNQWEQTQCRKQEIQGRSMSDECIAARRLSSILNKAVMTINYNEVSHYKIFSTTWF